MHINVGRERLELRLTDILGVFDIEPQHVHRNIVLIESLRNFLDILLVQVIPPALMVSDRKHLR
jgi:hypothetical protein